LSLIDHSETTIRKLDDFTQRHDRIVECATITGADDYMIKVMARDPEDLERFLMHDLLALGVVRSSTTHFVLRQTKYTTAVPLD
ncbi:MAG: Lrp/AsnC ligand binding domain-containing protein, partial [Tabrizicola sp.]|nr:Lrp/AsnC ligand binding domain-containing protein [Tabrizicola sp.]